MNYYLIRHKETKAVMPQYKNGKGYSYWLHDEIKDNQLPVPRLLDTEARAKKCIAEWAKGIFEWVDKNEEDQDDYLYNPKRVMKPLNRRKEDLEIVKIELKEI